MSDLVRYFAWALAREESMYPGYLLRDQHDRKQKIIRPLRDKGIPMGSARRCVSQYLYVSDIHLCLSYLKTFGF